MSEFRAVQSEDAQRDNKPGHVVPQEPSSARSHPLSITLSALHKAGQHFDKFFEKSKLSSVHFFNNGKKNPEYNFYNFVRANEDVAFAAIEFEEARRSKDTARELKEYGALRLPSNSASVEWQKEADSQVVLERAKNFLQISFENTAREYMETVYARNLAIEQKKKRKIYKACRNASILGGVAASPLAAIIFASAAIAYNFSCTRRLSECDRQIREQINTSNPDQNAPGHKEIYQTAQRNVDREFERAMARIPVLPSELN